MTSILGDSEDTMRVFNRVTGALACGFFCMSSTAVFGGGVLTITIVNDSTDSLLVTVYDQNSNPPQQVLSGAALNGSASQSVSISADDSGRGHLSWKAMTADPDMRQCGHKDKPNLNDGDTVRVHADGDCSG
ncbi:MAG TPA: hypothetical protein VKG63_09995 [Steroidobacteraceae bacterium]|nr:hypothetical protein [Steroidobacteraceae bacterium]